MGLMPFLAVPEPRYLQAALGPVEAHTTAEQLLMAAEHLLILTFGSFSSKLRKSPPFESS
jgi:hypothetical protein